MGSTVTLTRSSGLRRGGPLRKRLTADEYAALRDPKNWKTKPEKIKVGLRKRRKTRKGQVSISTLNDLWGEVIRRRDKTCQMCGELAAPFAPLECAGNLEAAHMYSKKAFPSTRWDVDNGNALCTRHHFFVHTNPVAAGRFYEARWGREHLDSLWIRAIATAKIDRHAVRESLKSRLREMEHGT